jgi:hypothetical protein
MGNSGDVVGGGRHAGEMKRLNSEIDGRVDQESAWLNIRPLKIINDKILTLETYSHERDRLAESPTGSLIPDLRRLAFVSRGFIVATEVIDSAHVRHRGHLQTEGIDDA